MIRRNPTLIGMTDADVQDVREMVAKQKTDGALLQKMKQLAENPNFSAGDTNVLEQIKLRHDSKDSSKRDAAAGPSNS
uniref:Uncharacterized protein n=1 Tax=Mycena chlorophos TaxID=658473 RepID=A0ABQ0L0E2_MYCCL|nr:predicted protein [Mycena chlorophos]